MLAVIGRQATTSSGARRSMEPGRTGECRLTEDADPRGRGRSYGALSELLGHKLVRHSAIYASSGVARNAIPFLLMPVLTRYLSPADVGIVATFEVMLAMGLVLIGLNMHGAI